MKNITQFFKQDLGAPLVNQMWSWGAVDGRGGVFLRVWQKDWQHRARRSLVIAPDWKPTTLGYKERLAQLAMIDAGASGYLVVCNGHFDEASDKMVVTEYREDKVFPIESIEWEEGTAFARWKDPVGVDTLRAA